MGQADLHAGAILFWEACTQHRSISRCTILCRMQRGAPSAPLVQPRCLMHRMLRQTGSTASSQHTL